MMRSVGLSLSAFLLWGEKIETYIPTSTKQVLACFGFCLLLLSPTSFQLIAEETELSREEICDRAGEEDLPCDEYELQYLRQRAQQLEEDTEQIEQQAKQSEKEIEQRAHVHDKRIEAYKQLLEKLLKERKSP